MLWCQITPYNLLQYLTRIVRIIKGRTYYMKKNVDMLNGPVFSGMLRYAIPVILTSLMLTLFNTVDLIVVGQYCGSICVAAVSATSALTNLIVNFFVGFSTGTGVSVARATGAKNADVVHKLVHTAMPAAAICGGAISLIGIIFAPTFLQWMDTPANVLPLSSVYMRIYFSSMVFNMVYNFSASILRAVGETKLPLFFLFIAGVINLSLNIFFVTVFKMNVDGVALATAISKIVAATLAVTALARRTDACQLIFKDMRIYPKELLKIIKHGFPAGLQSSLFALSNVFTASAINSFDSQAVISGNGAAQNIQGMMKCVTSGFYTTATNYIGQNAGAKNYKRVRKVLFSCLACSASVVITITLIIYGLSKPILGLYITDNPEAIQYGIIRMTYMTLPYFLLGLMDVATGALRGLGYSFVPMIISLMGACGLRILWIHTIFQIPQYHTLPVLYQIYPISWFLTFFVSFVLFLFLLRKKQKIENTLPQRSIA